MKTKKIIVKLGKLIFLMAGIVLLAFLLFQLLKGDFFKINQVICFDSPDRVTPCQADVWFKVNGLLLGKNIIFLSPQKTEQLVKGELSGIDQVGIQKRLPNKLIVYLTKRKPIAVVEAANEYYQVDYQGVVLAKLEKPTDLPLIVNGQSLAFNDNQQITSPSVLSSLNFLYQLLMKSIEIRRMEITNSQELTIVLRAGPQVLISLNKDANKQVDSLQLILERAKIEGKQIELIDLRFDKPVISYR